MLKKLGLIKSINLEFDSSKDQLLSLCQNLIDSKNTQLNLSKGKKNYAGSIENNNLIFKHKRSLFSGLLSYPKVYGEITQNSLSNKSKIHFEIYGFTGVFLVLTLLLLFGFLTQFLFNFQNNKYYFLFYIFSTAFVYLISLVSVRILSKKIIHDFSFNHDKS